MTFGDSTSLNTNTAVFWFDDFGTPNNDHKFLSNFYVGAPLVMDWGFGDQTFKTGEHAFAAAKASTRDDALEIEHASTPGQAKSIGRSIPLRPRWEVVKLDAMAAVVRAKFDYDREEGDKLLETGDKYLCEGTYWRDEVWGVDLSKSAYPGRNWLGTLLMMRRAELRSGWVTHTRFYNEAFVRTVLK